MTQDTDNLDEMVGKISRWLTEHGPRAEHLGRVMESLCPQIQQAGVPLARMTMHLRALHSERMGTTRIWSQGESVQEVVFDYGSRTEHFYQASPIKVVHETREPIVDVFEEKDHVLVVAEMPGVEAEDVRIEVADDILVLKAERGDKKYSKEVLLPVSVRRDGTTAACKNGIVEIKALKH